jgi:ABC-type phosphate/phosphonate transport system substrate-binding protein
MRIFRFALPELLLTAVLAWPVRAEELALRVGVVAGEPAAQASLRLEPFRAALQESLRADVELLVFRDAAALIEAAVRGRANYAVLSAGAFGVAQDLCDCLEALALARSSRGETAFRQVVIAPAGGPGDLAALKTARIAAVRTAGFGGFDLAIAGFADAGVAFAADAASLSLHADSAAVMAELASGAANAAIAWMPAAAAGAPDALPALFAAAAGAEVYRVIWQSADIPYRLHAVRKDLPDKAKTRLRESLTGLFGANPGAYDAIEPDHGGGFVAARQGQFGPMLAVVRRLRGKTAAAK